MLDPGPGEQADVPRPDWYDGPLVVLTGVSGGVATRADDRRATVLVDRCDARERRKLWAALLPRASKGRLDALAEAFVVPDGHVRRLAADATVVAEVDGRRAPTLADVRQAARRLGDHVLETKATRLDNDALSWDDVVTGPSVRGDLELLEHRCRLREELAVGDRGVGGAGVRALLTGPSGCGKTLAARTLAAVLDRNIYRVDLAAVFDKYVGVTEKILERLLTDAEQLDSVLLLDEGDTFLGSRTDVRSANDRYANLETNFLLQRLETYAGIIVVTTNAPDRIDSAFARRMDATIAFGKPRSVARRRIWALHLPPGHGVPPAELDEIADRHRLTGGQIRNAAQYARLLSARDGTALDARRPARGRRRGVPEGGRDAHRRRARGGRAGPRSRPLRPQHGGRRAAAAPGRTVVTTARARASDSSGGERDHSPERHRSGGPRRSVGPVAPSLQMKPAVVGAAGDCLREGGRPRRAEGRAGQGGSRGAVSGEPAGAAAAGAGAGRVRGRGRRRAAVSRRRSSTRRRNPSPLQPLTPTAKQSPLRPRPSTRRARARSTYPGPASALRWRPRPRAGWRAGSAPTSAAYACTTTQAARSTADSMGAKAFTQGSDISLGSGQSADDLGLMAHEAAHVVQQAGGSGSVAQRDPAPGTATTPAAAPAAGTPTLDPEDVARRLGDRHDDDAEEDGQAGHA